jgi:MarR family transcriptional repressor of emrRAB
MHPVHGTGHWSGQPDDPGNADGTGAPVPFAIDRRNRLQRELEAIVKPFRVNHSEFTTLMILYSRPDGCSTPGELCDLAAQGATNMTRIANALLKRGLISRRSNARDRRQVVIRITAAGRRFAQLMLPPMFPRLADAFTGFNAGERHELRRLLCKLAANLDQLDSGVTP